MPPQTRSQLSKHITISERDEAGNAVATYVHSRGNSTNSDKRTAEDQRVDVVWPENPKPILRRLLDVFLPAGYPGSVTEDYLWYQIYDSLQAFSSSIAGLLSSRAVLEGVGVGNADASPTNALYLSIIQESVGRIATILFAHRFGTMIEPECKMYRLLADVFNDAAMILDCLSPAFPGAVRVGILGGSSTLRALCGVAAGSAKGCLSAHFAMSGNLGELNAKDSSQETVISLLGMLVGSVVVSQITSPVATWSSLFLLLAIHLAMNYLAVRSVQMRSLNQQRANIVFSTIVEQGRVPGPREVSQREYIFSQTDVLRWQDNSKLGDCYIGAPLHALLRNMRGRGRYINSFSGPDINLSKLLGEFDSEQYILWFSPFKRKATIVLKDAAGPKDQLKAWVHALMLAQRSGNASGVRQSYRSSLADPGHSKIVETAYNDVCRLFQRYTTALERAGWDLGVAHLETRSGTRIKLEITSDNASERI